MKALILAGGRGKRLKGESSDKNKCMVAVSGKPLIEYSLDTADKIDVSEIVIVVGYRAREIIKAYGYRYKTKRLTYVKQNKRKGLVHAIECARKALGKEDFILLLGDELLYNPRHLGMLRCFREQDLFALCGVLRVKNRDLIKKTYSIIQSRDKRIFRLIEKPEHPMDDIMGTGNCLFRNEILSYLPKTPINQKRREKELPDLIQCAIDDGKIVKSFLICQSYINVNDKKQLREARSYFGHY